MAAGGLLGDTDGSVLEVCQALPGQLLVPGEYAAARQVLMELGATGGFGVLPGAGRRKGRKPDVLANLWFVQSVHVLPAVAGEGTWRGKLLGQAQEIVQGLIAGKFAGIQMGDGGLLGGRDGAASRLLEINIMWYDVLSILGEEVRRASGRGSF